MFALRNNGRSTASARHDLLWTLAIRLFNTGVGVLSAVLTARLLGPEGRGQYYLALTLSATTLQFVSFGMQSSNTYLVAGKPSLFPTLHAGTFWFALSLGAGAGIVIGCLVEGFQLLPGLSPLLVILAMAGIAPGLYYLLAANLLVGVGSIRKFNLYETLNRAIPFLLIVAFWWTASPTVFFSVTVAGSFLVAASIFRRIHKDTGGVLRPDLVLIKSGLSYGGRVYVTTLLGFLLSKLSVFLLARLGTTEDLGYFSVAMQIGEMMSLIPATVSLLLFPKLVKNRDGRNLILTRNLIGVAAIMLVGCLLAGSLAPYLIPWLMGQPFRPAVPMFIWLLPGIFFLSLITILSQYLAAFGFPWTLPSVWLVGIIVLGASGIPLIERYGANGASISISLAYLVVVIGVSILCLSHRFAADQQEAGT